MRKWWVMLLTLAMLGAAAGRAQETVRVYVEAGAMEESAVSQLERLLERAFEVQVEVSGGEEAATLRALVLADCAPNLAICAPQTAAPWAKEGLTLPLRGCVCDLAHMQREVVAACTHEGTLFMAPLLARHRTMAVNRTMMEARALGGMLDGRAHPVWMPMEMSHVLEEFAFGDVMGMEIWPARTQDAAGIEAFVQALYDGRMITEAGETDLTGAELAAGLAWLRERMNAGMIGLAPDRETALARFLAGETAIFLDWTQEEEALLEKSGLDVLALAYPSSTGLPVRAAEIVGMTAFASGDACRDELALEMIAFVQEDVQAQIVLGGRAIWTDGAIWLTPLGADNRAAVLKSALCAALEAVVEGGCAPEEALEAVSRAIEGL